MPGAAAMLPEGDRKDLAIQALARSTTISDLSVRHRVSRKFVYQQAHKAGAALDEVFLSGTEQGSWSCREAGSDQFESGPPTRSGLTDRVAVVRSS
jgi:hypothetical protein